MLVVKSQWQTAQLAPTAWSELLLIAGFVAIASTAVTTTFFVKRRSLERRIYWAGWLVGTPLMASAVLPRGGTAAIAVALLCVFAATVYAYFRTPYLKLGNHIYAFTIPNSQPDPPADATLHEPPPQLPRDSYRFMGGITARNAWWVLAGLTAIAAANVILAGWVWYTILIATFLVVAGVMSGVDDSTRKLPIARGQKTQAYIATVASIPLWLLPAVAYLVGYRVGKRWPTGKGKHAAPPLSL